MPDLVAIGGLCPERSDSRTFQAGCSGSTSSEGDILIPENNDFHVVMVEDKYQELEVDFRQDSARHVNLGRRKVEKLHVSDCSFNWGPFPLHGGDSWKVYFPISTSTLVKSISENNSNRFGRLEERFSILSSLF